MATDKRHLVLEAELTAHARSLRALARLLVGPADAEDLVQETALQALKTPPARTVGLKGWLTQVLTRLASNHRRAERRRRQREAESRTRAPEPSAAEVHEEHEAVRRLMAVLLDLPEPYRRTLMERFFEDLPPAAIARRSNLPLATVKSRLQRGLTMLRERMDQQDGGQREDWRQGLAAVFGFESLVALGATTGTGVLVMGSVGKWLVGGVAVAVASTALVWFWPVPVHDEERTGLQPPEVVAELPGVEIGPLPSAPTLVERTEVVAEQPPRPQDGPVAIVRGRCVDTAGQPLAGVSVRLRSGVANAARIDAWTKDHEPPEKIDIQEKTGADGSFLLRFWPPPPFQYFLSVRLEGRVELSARWFELKPGTTTDLADLVLHDGVQVLGRIVDEQGRPVASQIVRLRTSLRPKGVVEIWATGEARSDPAGRFKMTRALLPGTYQVGVGSDLKVTPSSVNLEPIPRTVELDLVVQVPTKTTLLAGVVVDRLGQPIRDAKLTIPPLAHEHRPVAETSTDRQGRFVLAGQSEHPTHALDVEATGYERLKPTERFATGTTDLRLVLDAGMTLEITAIDRMDQQPIEDYQVRVFQLHASGRMSGAEFAVRKTDRPESGRVLVPGITKGDWHVIVEPKGDTWAVGHLAPIHVGGTGPVRVTVPLARRVSRTVRVVTPDGAPIVGTRIELADMQGKPGVTSWTRVAPLTSMLWTQKSSGLLIDDVVADGNGEGIVSGPEETSLVLFVRGPGHVPAVQSLILRAREDPLVITVGAGARLVASVTPLAARSELMRITGLDVGQEPPENQRHRLPGFYLIDRGVMPFRYFPASGRVPLEKDGVSTIDGIPEGRWEVHLVWDEPVIDLNINSQTRMTSLLTHVDLADGVTHKVKLDLTYLLPGTLQGRVFLDGAPAGERHVAVTTVVGTIPDGREETYIRRVMTDAEGRFQLLTRGGVYRLQEAQALLPLHATETAHVVIGQTTEMTFHLRSARLRLRVLDSTGKPAAQIELEMTHGTRRSDGFRILPRTDRDGFTEATLDPKVWQLSVLPRRLQDPAVQQKIQMSHRGGGDPFAAERIQLREINLEAGPIELELQLPEQFER